ncbi:helix-turn-helix transcriptional regulator [Arthrobacter sp. TES]|nr:helix-turn-helix transcriptional regulator [Arthrobacter sp. TES]
MGMPTPEEKVAENLERLRTEAGLTYEGLAQKLMGMGIRIHPSAIQKTEKSGRKATIKEMLAYSRLFNIPVQQLWGGYAPSDDAITAQRDLAAAEKILKIQKQVRQEYDHSIRAIAELAIKDDSVRRDLEARVVHQAMSVIEVSSDGELNAIYGWEHALSILRSAPDVPIDVETAIDCLLSVREMEGEPEEHWTVRMEREREYVEQSHGELRDHLEAKEETADHGE